MKRILSLIIVLAMTAGMLAGASENEPERNLYVNGTQIGEGLVVKFIAFEEDELLVPLEESLVALGFNIRKEDGCIYFDFSGENFIFQFQDAYGYTEVFLSTVERKNAERIDEYVNLGTWSCAGVCYFINDRIYITKHTAKLLFFFLGYDITFDEEEQSARISEMEGEPPYSLAERYMDIYSNDWFKYSVKYVTDKAYMEGENILYFSPNTPADRSTVISVLYNIEGKPTDFLYTLWFGDVKSGDPYIYPLMWAKSCGIVNGVGDNKFNPEENVTRQDFAVMLLRYIEYKKFEYETFQKAPVWADEAEISDYAKEAVDTLCFLGIIKGKENNIVDPKGYITRAEVAVVIQRMMNYFLQDSDDAKYPVV